MKNNQKILGIDPGIRYSGFAVLKKENHKVILIDSGCLHLTSINSLAEKIHVFHKFFQEKIVHHFITTLALEKPFLWKNADTFLKLGYLRGIVHLLSWNHTLTLHEFSPREVKQAITGYGAADKEQIARLLLKLFPGLNKPEKNDTTDALAVALCCLWMQPHLKNPNLYQKTVAKETLE